MADRDSNFRTFLYTKVAAVATKEVLTANPAVGGDWIKFTAPQANTSTVSVYTRNDDAVTYTLAGEVVKGLDPIVIHSRALFPIRGTDLYVDGIAGQQMLVEFGTDY